MWLVRAICHTVIALCVASIAILTYVWTRDPTKRIVNGRGKHPLQDYRNEFL